MRPDPDRCRDPDLLAAEVRRLRAVVASTEPTLTDAEREAVADICEFAEDFLGDDDPNIATLRGLLNRLGGKR